MALAACGACARGGEAEATATDAAPGPDIRGGAGGVVGMGGGGAEAAGGMTAAPGGASGAFGAGAGMPAIVLDAALLDAGAEATGGGGAGAAGGGTAAALPGGGIGAAPTGGGIGWALAGGGAVAAAPGAAEPAPEAAPGVAPAVAIWAGGAAEVAGASGELSTGRRGAADGAGGGPLGAGGALAAGMVALATGADPAGPADAEADGGGAMVPWPNSPGDAEGEDGSDKGVAAAMYSACARSATRPWVIASSALRSGASGLAGTVARLGYGSVAPGGGGRCLAISPPSMLCHQLTGLIDDGTDEQPASTGTAPHSSTHTTA